MVELGKSEGPRGLVGKGLRQMGDERLRSRGLLVGDAGSLTPGSWRGQ